MTVTLNTNYGTETIEDVDVVKYSDDPNHPIIIVKYGMEVPYKKEQVFEMKVEA